MPHKVELTYFKPSGKFYSDGEYETQKEHMFEIFDEVRQLSNERRLPGLHEGHSEYHVIVGVPGHPHDHPHLVTVKFSSVTLPTFERVIQQG